jgi:hypothetical protein
MKKRYVTDDGHLIVRLWHDPYNGGWVWFSREHLFSFRAAWHRPKLWWTIFGFCGSLTLQSWPWRQSPAHR